MACAGETLPPGRLKRCSLIVRCHDKSSGNKLKTRNKEECKKTKKKGRREKIKGHTLLGKRVHK